MPLKRNPEIPKRGQGKAAQAAPVRSSVSEDEQIHVCIDKNISDELHTLASELAIAENADNIPVLPFGASLSPSQMALVTGKKWQNGRTINCAFIGGEKAVHDKVIKWAKTWETYANLKFNFVSDLNKSDIRIAFDKTDGSWSYIGTDSLTIPKTEATMNYGWLTPSTDDSEYSRVVLHEFGHAIGFIHEHQHPEVGIPWNKDAVYAYYMGPPNNWSKDSVDNNLFKKYNKNITQYSVWDKNSIMSYAVPKQLTDGNFSIGWNRILSDVDKIFVQTMYPFPKPEADAGFLTRLYEIILKVLPSSIEIEKHLPLVKESRMKAIEKIERSDKAVQMFTKEIYQFICNREPTTEEMTDVGLKLSRRITEEQVMAELVVSNKPTFSLLSKEIGNVSYDSILAAFNGNEWRTAKVKEYYKKILDREPTFSELNAWVNSTLDLATIRFSIEGSEEFYRK